MRDASGFATQWAGMVALVRLQGAHSPGARLIEADGMVASLMPVAPASSIMNCALAVDPAEPPSGLDRLADAFNQGGAQKWGLWVDGDDERAAEAARRQGMMLDSRHAPAGAAPGTSRQAPPAPAPRRARTWPANVQPPGQPGRPTAVRAARLQDRRLAAPV